MINQCYNMFDIDSSGILIALTRFAMWGAEILQEMTAFL